MVGIFRRLWRDRAGISVLEYAFLVGIITTLVVVGVAVAGAWAHGVWAHLLTSLG
jgi:Flp pilus assembly pilin Flp